MKVLYISYSKPLDLIKLKITLQLLRRKYKIQLIEFYIIFLDKPNQILEPLLFRDINWTMYTWFSLENIRKIRSEILPIKFDLLILKKSFFFKNLYIKIFKAISKIKFCDINELQKKLNIEYYQPKIELFLDSKLVKDNQELIHWIFNSSLSEEFNQSKFILFKFKDYPLSSRKYISRMVQILKNISKISRLKIILILENSTSRKKKYLLKQTENWGKNKLIMNFSDNYDLKILFFLARQAKLIFTNDKVSDEILSAFKFEYFNLNKKRISRPLRIRHFFNKSYQLEKKIDRINYYIKQKIQ